jgi:hypothetical protein
VEEDLRMLGVKRWRRKALEREEWAFVIKEAKVKLKGPRATGRRRRRRSCNSFESRCCSYTVKYFVEVKSMKHGKGEVSILNPTTSINAEIHSPFI